VSEEKISKEYICRCQCEDSFPRLSVEKIRKYRTIVDPKGVELTTRREFITGEIELRK